MTSTLEALKVEQRSGTKRPKLNMMPQFSDIMPQQAIANRGPAILTHSLSHTPSLDYCNQKANTPLMSQLLVSKAELLGQIIDGVGRKANLHLLSIC